jgi:uncharacterized membrane protein
MLPLHPAIVHAPLGLALAVPVLLLALTIALFRRKVSPRAFLVGVLLQAIVVGGGLLALATGNAEESRVEAVVSEAALDRHEDLATIFVIMAAATLVTAVAASFTRDRWSRGFAVVSTGASVGVLALGLAVGHAGGNLVYRDGAASVYSNPASQPGAAGRARAPEGTDRD